MVHTRANGGARGTRAASSSMLLRPQLHSSRETRRFEAASGNAWRVGRAAHARVGVGAGGALLVALGVAPAATVRSRGRAAVRAKCGTRTRNSPSS